MQTEFEPVKAFGKYGKAVARLREAAGMKQEELAERAGVGARSISNVELQTRDTRLGTLDAILAALGVNVLEFAAAVAKEQGLDVSDAEIRERQRDKFKELVAGAPPIDSGSEWRELNRRLEVLEAFRDGVEAGSRFGGKRGSD